ncbi:BspA family leucine-rich repeat surface protein [Clostridiaceae bacterium Marseille-Q4145]|nr:BspA family leucine-rich repeat surface protein [Clostridiaceae bacterium Marseille-Q4145]
MRRKKKFTSVLSLALSLLMVVSCIQPVNAMATQADSNVESVSEEATTQADSNVESVSEEAATQADPNVESVSEEATTQADPNVESVSEEATTQADPNVESVSEEATTQTDPNVESVSEEATTQTEEKQTTNVLSFENTADQLSVELTKESDFDLGLTAAINLLKDNAYEDVVENLKKSLEEQNEGYTVNLDTPLATEVNVLDEDGNKKDAGKVSAKIFTDASALEDSALYHQKEDQTWEEIQFEIAEDSSYVAFDAEKLGNFVFAKADLTETEETQAEEKQTTNVLSFENTADQLSVELTKESDFDLGLTAAINLLKDNAYEDVVENLKKSLEEQNEGYTVNLDIPLAIEVNVLDEDGNEKDAGKVSVKIFTDASVLEDSVLYHQKEDQTWEEIQFEIAEDSSYVAFDAEKLGNFVFAEPAALTDPEISPLADTDAYAILYESGELVFQRGSTPDASKGKVLKTYTGFETETYTGYPSGYAPWYENRTSIKAVSFKDVIKPVSTAYWFSTCRYLTDVDFKNLDTSAVTNMDSMFSGCWALKSLDVSSFDTSAVTNMDSMFYQCDSLTSLDLSSFHTSAVTSMDEMFYGCTSLTSLDVSSFDTSAVTSMVQMFYACSSLTSLDLSSFNTSAVKNMDEMFPGCSSLTSLDLSSFNTSAVTSMDEMFRYCTSLTSLNVSSFHTSAVTSMDKMFFQCSSLTSLDLRSFNTSAITSMDSMFYECSSLTSLNVSSFDTSAVTDMDYMFCRCGALKSLDLSSFNTSAVRRMVQMFYECRSLTSLDVSSFDTKAVTNMACMFSGCRSLTSLDVSSSSFDTSAVTDMDSMFERCSSLTSLDVSSFNTQAVTNMDSMFWDCSSLTSLDLRSFNTSAVTNMARMFPGCSSLTSLDVSSFNTSAVTDMDYMFYNCSSLTSLDLKSFNTQAVTSMDSMFFGVSTFTLGQNFTFKTGALPTSSTWRGLKQGKDYTDTKLQSTYDGTTMADTYVKYFDIKFDALGGKSSESKKFGYIGIAFDSLPTATKTGNVFLGWFTEKNGRRGIEGRRADHTKYLLCSVSQLHL